MARGRAYQPRAKIICTIGPASAKTAVLGRMVRAGMNVARLNLSHGTFADHAVYISRVREAAAAAGKPVAILIDLPGPKYRIGKLEGGQVTLRRGQDVRLTGEDITGNSTTLPVTLPSLDKSVRPHDTVILDDGTILLRVRAIEGGTIVCRVNVGGVLLQGRGLVVPGMKISVPFMTDRLRECLAFAVTQQPDYLALSFVTTAGDITGVRAVLEELGTTVPIIAKIERVEAVANFTKILDVVDAVMVARGDLGVEMPLERVPLIQKDLIRACNRVGKPVITATEMLESMINEARPTRAEATDVANAIFDGTDAIMLSAETSIGKYPVESVRTMARISRAAEKRLRYNDLLAERRQWLSPETDEVISFNTCQTAYSLNAACIVAFTQSGSTARRISKFRPSVPILALTPNSHILGQLLLYWGVRPEAVVSPPGMLTEAFKLGARIARDLGLAHPGDIVIISAGVPIGEAGTTNLLKVERVTDEPASPF
jgi:pyruvate kinase